MQGEGSGYELLFLVKNQPVIKANVWCKSDQPIITVAPFAVLVVDLYRLQVRGVFTQWTTVLLGGQLTLNSVVQIQKVRNPHIDNVIYHSYNYIFYCREGPREGHACEGNEKNSGSIF